jgi:hypothetical protein
MNEYTLHLEGPRFTIIYNVMYGPISELEYGAGSYQVDPATGDVTLTYERQYRPTAQRKQVLKKVDKGFLFEEGEQHRVILLRAGPPFPWPGT